MVQSDLRIRAEKLPQQLVEFGRKVKVRIQDGFEDMLLL